MLGLAMGLYGAGVFQSKNPEPLPQVNAKTEKSAETPKNQAPTTLDSSGTKPSKPSSMTSKTPGPAPSSGKPGPKLAPTDPNFVPTVDPEPIDPIARDPEVPDMDPEPIKKN